VTSLEAGGRSSDFALDPADIANSSIAVGNLIYKRVGAPLLQMPVIADYSGTRYVRTSVTDASGTVLGSNFYWTNPDTLSQWAAGSRTNRGTNSPTVWTNYTAIHSTLKGTSANPVDPMAVLAEVTEQPSPEPGWGALSVKLTNTGDLPALQIHINGKDENGEQILPFIADDNYITLFPGESRTLSVTYQLSGREGNQTKVGLDGFNVVAATIPILPTSAEVAELSALITTLALHEDAGYLYTTESFGAFTDAMNQGRAALAADPLSKDDVVAAITAIWTAYDGLTAVTVNTSPLVKLIEIAQEILDHPDPYVSTNLSDLEAAVVKAKGLLTTPGALPDQEAVTAAVAELALALADVPLKGDKTALAALIGIVQGLDSNRYTPASWTPVQDALGAAVTVNNTAEPSIDDVEEVFTALSGALSDLVLRAAKAGLQSAIDVAETILESASDYVPTSLNGLTDPLATAKRVLIDDDATTTEVSDAQTALIAAIAAVRLRPGSSPASASWTEVPSSQAPPAGELLLPASYAAAALDPVAALAATEVAQTAASDAVPAAGVKAFVKVGVAKITGKAKVGKTVRAKGGKFSPAARLSYQWYRGAKKIQGATKATYKVRKADRGATLRVKVIAGRDGYASVVKVSAKVKVKAK
jgi:hypothetical protein